MDTDEYDTVSPFRGGPLGGIAKAQMNDNCLLCGFSVSRRSGQGPPEGNVCYQCVSLKGDGAGELWKLPYMMKQHEYSDDMVNETKTRMIKAANSSFNKTDDVVTVMSVFGESFTLSKTAYALREARLNRKMTHLYYNGDTAHIARHILKGDKALHGVLLTETPQPNSIKCLVRLGGTKKLTEWPCPPLQDLNAEGCDSCQLGTFICILSHDQVLHVTPPAKSNTHAYTALLVALLAICAAYFLMH